MGTIEMMVRGFVGTLPYIGAAFVLLVIFKVVHDWLTPFDDRRELQDGNAAAGINRGGAYLGFLIAISGSLILSEESYWVDLRMFLLDGVIALAVFVVAHHVFDWVILRKIDNSREIQAGNKAVAIVEASSYVALGFIMCASFAGGGQSLWQGMLSAVMFSAIGMGTLMAIYATYCAIWRKRADIDRRIGEGNLAAAIDVSSLLLAMSLTLLFSISGNFSGWGTDLLSYAVAAVSSVLAVSVGRGLAVVALSNRLGTNGYSMHHGNVAKSSIIGLVSIGIGLLAGLVTFV